MFPHARWDSVCQDKERKRQFSGLSGRRHLIFLHRLKKGGLRPGGSPVYFIRKYHVGKNRPLDEFQYTLPCGGIFLKQFIAVMSEGIRSGVNCIRLNSRSSMSARLDTIRVLASPGTPTAGHALWQKAL